ncbi:putative retrotransposon hot spot (RHS) protein [Trypanosoma cruzi]|uniref:Putative retrotransposon hot spot (RHS) protein n=2 Tax=Trypanosoma cruzi TaxID=5693 RepID=V5AIV9_TRYCR|nr:putative retrotransposon hot spot (RHS) protein [Trypanosoma cruzi Dm28c]PWU92868.1 putative retrotransposon hot spot protein (RHS,) [Trypanosoma cruzi]RNE96836.1 putative retrotransposon hot spot (RHS) protein [Trypanosoma cruzi]
MKEKDTITPLARGKPNGVPTQVLTEARREEEERLRRAQEMEFTISTNIEDVLFRGEFRYREMKLTDFITLRFGGKSVVATNRSVLLKEFFKHPKRYIHDAGVLNEIKTTYCYLRMEWTVKEETNMEEDVRKLQYNHVISLLGWSLAAPKVKESVHGVTESFLDAALEDVRISMGMSASNILEGLYESVYNARWHHVVEAPGGEGTGLEVREGEPPQSWSYKKAGRTLEKDDGVEQSGAPRLRLMVLASDKAWPYSRNALHRCGNDFFINCEVERVWQIVLDDLTKWFSSHRKKKPSPLPRVLIGTAGIGKSMNAGSYLLYQLLHYDAEKLQVVVHCFGITMYVFGKTAKTVTRYMGEIISESVLDGLRQRGMKGYVI